MGFRDDERYTGQTGDPVHDEIYGWDMGSVSDSDYQYTSRPDNSHEESSHEKTDEEKLDEIIAGMFLSVSQEIALKNKVLSFYNARDCTNLTVNGGYGEYIFVFTRQNRYIKTTNEFYYYPEMGDINRIFWEFYTTHDYDNLLKDPEFKRMIKSTGLKFVRCSGGYVAKYMAVDDEIIMKDELDIRVILKSGTEETCYAIDLDKMELTRKLY